MCTTPNIPQYADDAGDATPVDRAVLEDLAVANRILFDQGVVDAFGHISLRHPHRPDRFLLARNMAPGGVTADDIIEFDLDSNPVNARGRGIYLERFIHGEIYKARPDVQSVAHSHSPSVVPFSVVPSVKLRAICHMSGFLGTGIPNFEIRACAGDATSLLISSRDLGRALAESLGEGQAVLMRGHGSTVCAPSLKLCVYRAVYTEVNAKVQAQALNIGPVVFLTEGEAATAMATTESQVDRPWNLWKARVS
jgi:HCOMODA/2-hydroxy-3-carboxy-muconic semialdehyde decarboxylase